MLGPSQNAHVIIFPLVQPHRFDFAMQCACGFQHHGFANADTSKGDTAEEMRAAASSHLLNRHGVPQAKLPEHFVVLSEAHSGGVPHATLKNGIDSGQFKPLKVDAAHQAKLQKKEVSQIESPTMVETPKIEEAAKPVPQISQAPAKQVQPGGVKK